MEVFHTISTPWAPYTVTFRRDGDRLVIGGGTFYGQGGIMFVSLSGEDTKHFPYAELVKNSDYDSSVSGICLSDDDRYLVASTWSWRHHYSPTYLFEISGTDLSHQKTLIHNWHDEIGDPCPTGVLFHNGFIVVRNNATLPTDVIKTWELPKSLGIQTENLTQHLTSSRMVIIDDMVITGGGGSGLWQWRSDMGDGEIGKACEGLLCATLKSDGDEVQIVPVDFCQRVTAIALTSAGDSFVTGGLLGEVDYWTWDGHWVQRRLQHASTKTCSDNSARIAWGATYEPASIVGICSLSEMDYWVTVDASGELCLYYQNKKQQSWQIPGDGTPRSIAAHPHKPRIAIAIKEYREGVLSVGSVKILSNLI